MPVPAARQLELDEATRKQLTHEIEQGWTQASRDMERRNNAITRWYRLWRAARDEHGVPEEQASNFRIPLIQWQILSKLAKELDALLGDDSEISVRPIGPSDAARSPKIQRYMNWRVKVSLKLFKRMYDYLQQKLITGTTIAKVEYLCKKRTVRRMVKKEFNLFGFRIPAMAALDRWEEEEKEIIEFEGPDMQVEAIEEWAVPPHAGNTDDTDIYRRLRLSVDELLDMADEGKIDGLVLTVDNLKKLRRLAETGQYTETTSTDSGKQVRDEKDAQSGKPAQPESKDETVIVVHTIRWFRSKTDSLDARAQEVVCYWQPETKLLLGASRLVDIYPDGRRPFIKSEMVRDGDAFFGIGLPEFLESINNEMDVQHNALTDASVYALGPVIFFEPASGLKAESFKYEPFKAYACANANGIKIVNFAGVNLGPYVQIQNQLLGFAERISGLTEAELGRPFDQPNAPRTLGQQQIIQAGSGVRLLLDLRLERESLREMLKRIWELDKFYGPPELFFRVSEGESFDVMTKEEMQGDYDFDIGPLTSTANKQSETMQFLQAYSLAQSSPIVLSNPPLMVEYLRELQTRMGLGKLNNLLPDLKAMMPPQDPEAENARMLQGEDVDPHPMDNDIAHIHKHMDFRLRMKQEAPYGPPTGENGEQQMSSMALQNPGLMGRIDSHIAKHEAKMKAGYLQGQLLAGALSKMTAPRDGNAPTDQTGQPNQAMNDLKSELNSGGGNIA